MRKVLLFVLIIASFYLVEIADAISLKDAQTINPGEYNGIIKSKEKDLYRVDITAGMVLNATLSIRALENPGGLTGAIVKNQLGLSILNYNGLSGEEIIADSQEDANVLLTSLDDYKIYILVHENLPVPDSGVEYTLKIETIKQNDANSGDDASNSPQNAIEISPGNYFENLINGDRYSFYGKGDSSDWYKIFVPFGKKLEISTKRTSKYGPLEMKLYKDNNKTEYGFDDLAYGKDFINSSPEALDCSRCKVFAIPKKDMVMYFRVSGGGMDLVGYTLNISLDNSNINIPDECSDSDNGKDYTKFGIAKTKTEEFSDSCKNQETLIENYCENDQRKTEDHDCLLDKQICLYGMCQKPPSPSLFNELLAGLVGFIVMVVAVVLFVKYRKK